MDIIEEKKALRKIMFAKRNTIDSAMKTAYDATVCAELEKLILDKEAKRVHAYIPMANEIDIKPLLLNLLEAGIEVVCPKTLPKRKLENRILKSLDHLETGIMGTQHPAEADIFEGKIDLIIVPGLAFDKSNYRLGYGGGYYDNFLVKHLEAYKIGIFYSFQEVEEVPREEHDYKLDRILNFKNP